MPSDTQTFQQEGYEWGGDINFAALVNGVADRFELTGTMPVTTKARLALITPALPHRMKVSQELLSGKINFHFLEDSIKKVLENAAAIAIDRNQHVVDENLIAASMKRYCPYLFWC
jgi:hypothetical protein